MADKSGVPIKGRAMRLIQLDSCGNPVTGASGLQVITKGFISLQLQPQYEDGTSQRQKLADGSLCVADEDPDSLVFNQLTFDFCGVCPSIEQIMSGARLLGTGAPVTGVGAVYSEGLITARFSVEVWQNVSGQGACDPATGAALYVYWAFPNVGNLKIGQSTIENAGLHIQGTAKTDVIGTQWGTGPGSLGPWVPSALRQSGAEHWGWAITSVAPPTIPANCGATPIT